MRRLVISRGTNHDPPLVYLMIERAMFVDNDHILVNGYEFAAFLDLRGNDNDQQDRETWIIDLSTGEIHEHCIDGYYPAISSDGHFLSVCHQGRLELWRISRVPSE